MFPGCVPSVEGAGAPGSNLAGYYCGSIDRIRRHALRPAANRMNRMYVPRRRTLMEDAAPTVVAREHTLEDVNCRNIHVYEIDMRSTYGHEIDDLVRRARGVEGVNQ